MIKNLVKIFLIPIFFSVVSLPHSDAQTTPCQITYKNGGGLNNTRMVGLHEDLLLVADTGAYKIINVEKISHIKFDNGTYFWTGAAFGSAVGFVTGFTLYQIFGASKNKKFITKDATLGTFVVFTLPCAVIGGLVGLLFRNRDDYDLSKLNSFDKSREINYIMKDHDIYK